MQSAASYLQSISIHALREEGDFVTDHRDEMGKTFLSTPSARRATARLRWRRRRPRFLSTPSARRATFASIIRCKGTNIFLSTPSARRATRAAGCCSSACTISIHALREEGDRHFRLHRSIVFLSTPSARRATGGKVIECSPASNFYPRPPRGGRPSESRVQRSSRNFYPRPPRGGRRAALPSAECLEDISIHALREEGDSKNRDKISIFKQIIQHSARI